MEKTEEQKAPEAEARYTPWIIVHTDGTHLRLDGRYSNRWTDTVVEFGYWNVREGLSEKIAAQIDAGAINPDTDREYFKWDAQVSVERHSIKTTFYPLRATEDVYDAQMAHIDEMCHKMYPPPDGSGGPRRFADIPLAQLNERMLDFKRHHGMKRPSEVRLDEMADFFYVLGLEPSIKMRPLAEEDEDAATDE